MARYRCGHIADHDNSVAYTDHGQKRYRCRKCYNELAKTGQQRRRAAQRERMAMFAANVDRAMPVELCG